MLALRFVDIQFRCNFCTNKQEAVQGGSHPAGLGLELLQSPPWGQQFEIAMWKVSGITCNAEGFVDEVGAVYVLERGKSGTNDLFPCSYGGPDHVLQYGRTWWSNRMTQWCRRSVCFRWCLCIKCCWALSTSGAKLLDQKRFSVMCTPRNLVVLTFSTATSLTVRGPWCMCCVV